MTEHVENLLLLEGRTEYRSQEGQNREFSVKAGAMSALGMAMYGWAITVGSESDDIIINTLLIFLALLVVAKVCILAIVVRPAKWRRPHDLSDIRNEMYNYEPDGMILGVGEAYKRAVRENWSILEPKAKCLKYMSTITIMSAMLFLTILSHIQWPHAIPAIIHFFLE